jgi:hypothetical protein
MQRHYILLPSSGYGNELRDLIAACLMLITYMTYCSTLKMEAVR